MYVSFSFVVGVVEAGGRGALGKVLFVCVCVCVCVFSARTTVAFSLGECILRCYRCKQPRAISGQSKSSTWAATIMSRLRLQVHIMITSARICVCVRSPKADYQPTRKELP